MKVKGPNTTRVLAAWAMVFVWTGGRVEAQEARTMTLREALTLAQSNSPVTIAAEGTVEVAEAARLESMGAFLPSLSVSSAYGNSSNQRFDQATGRLVSTSYSAQTQVGYDLFAGGRRLIAFRAANARLNAAEESLREAQFRTALQTTSLFYNAAAASELTTVAERRLERARRQLEFANTRLEVGTATRSDALRAELEVGNAEAALIDAQSALRSARLELGQQVGVGGEVQPVAAALPETVPALPAAEALAARAEITSPLVASAQASYSQTRAERLSSFTFYIPTVRLTGGYDWFSATEFPPRDRTWSLRITASLPLFNQFQREASLSRSAAAQRTAEARARDASLDARASAIDAAQQVESAGRRVQIARRAIELAREDLRVQEERYQFGVATILELQTSQVALAEAEGTYVSARQRLGVAIATLEAVLGEEISRD